MNNLPDNCSSRRLNEYLGSDDDHGHDARYVAFDAAKHAPTCKVCGKVAIDSEGDVLVDTKRVYCSEDCAEWFASEERREAAEIRADGDI